MWKATGWTGDSSKAFLHTSLTVVLQISLASAKAYSVILYMLTETYRYVDVSCSSGGHLHYICVCVCCVCMDLVSAVRCFMLVQMSRPKDL